MTKDQGRGSLTRRGLMKATAAASTGAVLPAALATGAPALHFKAQEQSGEVVANIKEGIKVQDPTLTGAMSDIAVNYHSYETLVESPRAGEFTPALAESWSNPDETTWEFKLQEGVTFHNGEPFNAESVRVTIERWMNPDVGAAMGPILFPPGSISGVEIVDDLTVQIKSEEPFGAMLASLQLVYMMPARATEEAGTDPITENIGTGPFRVTEWLQADHVTLEPFENYWREPANVAKLTYVERQEDATRMAAFRAEEIDILSDITSDQVIQLNGDERFSILQQETVESLYPVFNVTRPPFDDPRVRQALNIGIDMNAIVTALLQDGGAPQVAPISPQVFAFNDGLTPFTYDPDRARALLEEAGYGEGFDATFVVPGDRYPKGADLAQTIAASAAEIGVNITVEIPEQTVGFESRADLSTWDIFQWGISAVSQDPDFPLRWFFYQRPDPVFDGTEGGLSATSFGSDQIDQLLDEGLKSMDPELRAEKYKEAQALIWDAAPALWQHHVVDLYAVNNRVTGVELRPDKRANLRHIAVTD